MLRLLDFYGAVSLVFSMTTCEKCEAMLGTSRTTCYNFLLFGVSCQSALCTFCCGQANNGYWGTVQNRNLPFVHRVPSQALTLGGVAQNSLLPDPDPLQRIQREGSAKPISLTWPGALQALDQQGPGLRDDQHWDSGDGSVVQPHDGGGGDVDLGSPTQAVDEARCHREKNRKVEP